MEHLQTSQEKWASNGKDFSFSKQDASRCAKKRWVFGATSSWLRKNSVCCVRISILFRQYFEDLLHQHPIKSKDILYLISSICPNKTNYQLTLRKKIWMKNKLPRWIFMPMGLGRSACSCFKDLVSSCFFTVHWCFFFWGGHTSIRHTAY